MTLQRDQRPELEHVEPLDTLLAAEVRSGVSELKRLYVDWATGAGAQQEEAGRALAAFANQTARAWAALCQALRGSGRPTQGWAEAADLAPGGEVDQAALADYFHSTLLNLLAAFTLRLEIRSTDSSHVERLDATLQELSAAAAGMPRPS